MVLLKSSDRIVHDISEAFDGCTNLPDKPPTLQLALRRFVDMRPEREFRCFIRNHALIGQQFLKCTADSPLLYATLNMHGLL